MADETETFEVHLSAAQLRKFEAGKTFQLNSSQLSTGTTGHKVQLTTHRKHYKRMLRNIKDKKGFRFNPEHIEGGSVWDNASKAWKTIKHHGAKAVNFVKENAPKVGRFIKDNVPVETLKQIAEFGINELAPKKVRGLAKRVAKKAVDYGYDTTEKEGLDHIKDLAQSLTPEIKTGVRMAAPKKYKKQINKVLNIASPEPVSAEPVSADAPVDVAVEGSGFKSKRFVKGSAEAKEWGQRMRAMRQKKTGKGLGKTLLKAVAPALPYVGKTLGGLAGSALGGAAGAAVGSFIGNAAGSVGARVVGSGVRRRRHNHIPYGQLVDGVPNPVITEASADRINTHGLHHFQHGKNGLHKGGSFLALG